MVGRKQFRLRVCAGLAFIVGAAVPAYGDRLVVAWGTNISTYNINTSNGNIGLTSTSTQPAVPYTNAFSLIKDGSSNVYVSDAGANRVLQYNSSGTLSSTILNTAPNITDNTGLDPQSIAFDTGGSIWSASVAGQIVKTTTPTGTPSSTVATTISNARGIYIDSSNNAYVTTSAPGGATIVRFNAGACSTSSCATTTIYVGPGYPAGQLRGMTMINGTLYFADSGWNSSSSVSDGQIYKIASAATVTGKTDASAASTVTCSSGCVGSNTTLAGLGGPNSLALGATATTLLFANYYANSISLFDTTTGALTQSYINIATTLSGSTHVTGMVYLTTNFRDESIALPDEPLYFSAGNVQTPEPGTWVLLGSGLLLVTISALRRKRV